ncbi:MAG: hypothetical protein Q8J97_09675, partial [Flavobacteriaceae bacterium]|nr:hypothetical protein [Flavobacteriaceae bacterium]
VDPKLLRSDGAFPSRYLQSNEMTYDVSEPLRSSASVSSEPSSPSSPSDGGDDPNVVIGGGNAESFAMYPQATSETNGDDDGGSTSSDDQVGGASASTASFQGRDDAR